MTGSIPLFLVCVSCAHHPSSRLFVLGPPASYARPWRPPRSPKQEPGAAKRKRKTQNRRFRTTWFDYVFATGVAETGSHSSRFCDFGKHGSNLSLGVAETNGRSSWVCVLRQHLCSALSLPRGCGHSSWVSVFGQHVFVFFPSAFFPHLSLPRGLRKQAAIDCGLASAIVCGFAFSERERKRSTLSHVSQRLLGGKVRRKPS